MRVRLSWLNRNLKSAQVDVYRSSTSQAVPPESDKIASGINASVGYYDDTTALYGVTYYYVFRTYNGTATPIYSTPRQVKVLVDTGPGPAELLNGDYNLGYFGKLLYNEIGTTTDFATAVGLTISSQNQPLYWDKWVRKGKILFVPRGTLGTTAGTWAVYNAGCMYGTDTTGPSVYTGTKVNQNKRYVKNGYTFKVRVAKGIADEYNEVMPVAYTDINTVKAYRVDSEVAQIQYPRFRGLAIEAGYMQVADMTNSSWTSSSVVCGSTLTPDGLSTIGNMGQVVSSPVTTRSNISTGSSQLISSSSSSYYWPVLELDHQLLTVEV